jgi:hypothetical protein
MEREASDAYLENLKLIFFEIIYNKRVICPSPALISSHSICEVGERMV